MKLKQSSSLLTPIDRTETLIPPPLNPQRRPPTVKVLTSDDSVVIRIPEGVKLPIVATIRSSGTFDTQMSARQTRAGSAPEAGFVSEGTGVRSRSRAATISETTEPVSPVPENGPSLKSVRRGMLNISEASVPLPQSSDIVAQGEVFIPDHTKESDHKECANWTPPAEAEEESTEAEHHTPDRDASVENPPGSGQPTARSTTASTTGLEHLSAVEIPDIQIHAPSDAHSDVVLALGTGVINNAASAPVSSTKVTNTADRVSAPTAAASNLPAAIPGTEILPLAPPVDLPTPALPTVEAPHVVVPQVPATPARSLRGSKVGKRKRVVKKARKVVFRKRVLSMLLGREVAKTVHPLLEGGGRSSGRGESAS